VSPCEFGDLIKAENLKLFPTRDAAIQRGYDGCSTCLPEFSIASFGDLDVNVVHPPDVEPDEPVVVRADYADTLVRFNVTLSPESEETESTFASDGDEDGVFVNHATLSHIVPATWTVTVSCGAWSASTSVAVEKRFVDAEGHLQGPRTALQATVGQPGLELVVG
jgi:hypothetical protein